MMPIERTFRYLIFILLFPSPLISAENLIPSSTDAAKIQDRQTVQLRNSEAQIHYAKGNDFFKNKNYNSAISEYSAAIKIAESEKEREDNTAIAKAYNNRGLAYYKKDKFNFSDAKNDFDRAIKYDPNFAKAYCNRGIVYWLQSDYNSALKDFNKAIELDPTLWAAYNGRGNIYYTASGDEDAALPEYLKAIELNPKFARPYYNCGLISKHRGDYEKAVYYFSKAIENNPEYSYAYYQRGLVYGMMGDKIRSEQDKRKGRRSNPFVDTDYYFDLLMKILVLIAFFGLLISARQFYKKLDIEGSLAREYFDLSNSGLLFFPLGGSGNGAVLPDSATKDALMNEMKTGRYEHLSWMIPLFIFLGIALGALQSLIVIIILTSMVSKKRSGKNLAGIIKSNMLLFDVPKQYFYIEKAKTAVMVWLAIFYVLYIALFVFIWYATDMVAMPGFGILVGFVLVKPYLKRLAGLIRRKQLERPENSGLNNQIIS